MFESNFTRLIALTDKFANSEAALSFLVDRDLEFLVSGGESTSELGDKFSDKAAVPGMVCDLARLLAIGEELSPSVVLELGSGYSTVILSEVVGLSELKIGGNAAFARNPQNFKVVSLDESMDYMAVTRKRLSAEQAERVNFCHSTVRAGLFRDRICTFYDTFPNCLPDLIYLDGPSQFAPAGLIDGFDLTASYRMPMSADLLRIEYFLEPGCVLILDGRTANAHFLRDSFQRRWLYHRSSESDINLFMLDEPPLGSLNMAKLKARGLI